MSVYKQPKSNKWWFKFTWNGELIRKSTKQTNRRVAEQMEAAHRTSLAKGEVGIHERRAAPTLADFAPRFKQTIETECANKPATVSFYSAKLKHLLSDPILSRLPLDRIDEDIIDGYKYRRKNYRSRRGRPLAVASINRELATLRRMLYMAHGWKIVGRVPRLRLLRGEHAREFVLTHEIEAKYLAATSGNLRDVAVLMLDTGLRMGEALSLSPEDVHLKPVTSARYGYLVVRPKKSKNSKGRNIPLTARASAVLTSRLSSDHGCWVFQRPSGQRLSQTLLNEQHRKVRDSLKLSPEFVPHSFRHTFGTRLGEAGADAFTIMRLMGHSSVTISQRYVHPSPETVETAISRMEAISTKKFEMGIELGIPDNSVGAKTQQVS